MEDIRIRNIENYVSSYVNGDLLLISKRGTSGQAEDIRIRNIENYVSSYVNGDLLLISKRGTSGQAEEHAAMYAAEAAESSGQAEEHAAMYAAEASGTSTEQVHYVSKEELIASARYSKIVECLVRSGDTVISTTLDYRPIVRDILSTMTRKQLIEDKGRPCPKIERQAKPNYWLVHEDADLDIENTVWQSRKNNKFDMRKVNSETAIREILHLVNINQLTIQLTILTKQGDLIHYKA